MTIYVDVVFLENIVLNYIIIFSTAIISKSKIKHYRILIASSIGGVFSIVNYLLDMSLRTNILVKILLSILIILISFQTNDIYIIFKQLMFFYLVSFTYGGIAFMLLFFISPQNVNFSENHFVGTYPIKITLLASTIGVIIIAIISKVLKDRFLAKEMLYDLEIFYNGKTKKVKTMLDTGNLLKEPISMADVVIVEKNSLKEIVSENILENITSIIDGKWIDSNNIHSYKIKVIPFSSLGNENGMLIGFKPDYIKVYYENEIVRNDVLIGIYDGKLSKNNLFTSLIGLDVINKEGSDNN